MYIHIEVRDIDEHPKGFPQFWLKPVFINSISTNYQVNALATTYGLPFQQADDLRIVPLLKLRLQALRFRPRIFQRQQRIGAEIEALRATVVAVAKLV